MVVLKSDELELVFEPERGGKWRSLRDRRIGREWLWKNPHLPDTPLTYGKSFVETRDTGGWDEIFPTVLPCGNIPDHGDLVQLPWTVERVGEDRLTMSVEGRCSPFCFERTIILDESEIRLAYRLQNTGNKPFPWLWCAHPLLPFTPETVLETDAGFDVVLAMGSAEALVDHYVRLDELLRLDQPWAAKLFSKCGVVDSVTVRQAEGSGLRFEWDAREIPYLGLWINNGAWSGCGSDPYFNLIRRSWGMRIAERRFGKRVNRNAVVSCLGAAVILFASGMNGFANRLHFQLFRKCVHWLAGCCQSTEYRGERNDISLHWSRAVILEEWR